MASDDYRVLVEFSDPEHVAHLGRHLHEQELAQELREALGDQLIVTRDGPHVFLYASSETDAKAAEQTVGKLISQHGLNATVKPVERWHPVEKEWEDASKPLPASSDEAAAERERWESREAADSRADDIAEWEVRIELDSHHDAVALAHKLEAEGISPIVRRWKYLLIGAANEDGARDLSLQLEREVPHGAEVTVEAAPVWLYEGAGRHPISVMFGGLPGPRDQNPG